jgi:hypothetical protein
MQNDSMRVKSYKAGHTGDVKNTPGGREKYTATPASAVQGRAGDAKTTTDNAGKSKSRPSKSGY